MKKICVQCGDEFEITADEMKYYSGKGLDLPERCRHCRNRNSGRFVVKHKIKRPAFNLLGLIFLILAIAAGAAVFTGYTYSANINYYICLAAVLSFVGSICCFKNSVKIITNDYSFEQYKYNFYNAQNLLEHFEKHGEEVGCASLKDYVCAANSVISSRRAMRRTLENGDKIFFDKVNGNFVVLAGAGYIRSFYRTDMSHFLNQK